MEKQVACPICGETNKRTYFTENIGLCEDYYYCSTCGYFYHMCYSSPIEGFSTPPGKTSLGYPSPNPRLFNIRDTGEFLLNFTKSFAKTIDKI